MAGVDVAGRALAGDPAVDMGADGRMAALACAPDGTLVFRVQEAPGGNWAAWASLGRPSSAVGVAGTPVVAVNASGRLSVLAPGTDSGLWLRGQPSSNGTWE